MAQLLYAESQIPVQSAPQSQASPFVSLMPLVIIFVIFYFLLIRPQQKKLKIHKQMLDNLKVGAQVITSSGIYATIVGIGDASMEVKIADNVKIKILKSSVSDVIGAQDQQQQQQTPAIVK